VIDEIDALSAGEEARRLPRAWLEVACLGYLFGRL
jgi:hypothetical protein